MVFRGRRFGQKELVKPLAPTLPEWIAPAVKTGLIPQPTGKGATEGILIPAPPPAEAKGALPIVPIAAGGLALLLLFL